MAPPPPPPPNQLVLAASSAEAGLASWDLRTGAAGIRHLPCASRPRALASVGDRFLAAAQLSAAGANSGTIHFYHWDKAPVAVKSFPAEPIHALVANQEGTYIFGGGSNGNIFVWEDSIKDCWTPERLVRIELDALFQVTSGELLHTWHGHYRAVRCLALYDYWLVSGSEDGSIRVWDLITLLDEQSRLAANRLYLHNFSQHALPVTDIACFLGAIAISSSEDRTCKIWSLTEGRLLRSISFPTSIDSVALDARGHIFYAGGRDGKIYVAAMGVDESSHDSDGILGALDDHSKAITSLAPSSDGLLLVSGSEDGNVLVWDTRTQQVIRKFKHSQGPVTNVLIVTPKRVNLPSLQPLRKVCAGNVQLETVLLPQPERERPTIGYSGYAKRAFQAPEMHGDSSILFGAGAPNQQGIDWRSRYLELQDLFAGEVLDLMPSPMNT
ncbi:hypothetical protein ACP4OV_031057 [Aristida adscensionis]